MPGFVMALRSSPLLRWKNLLGSSRVGGRSTAAVVPNNRKKQRHASTTCQTTLCRSSSFTGGPHVQGSGIGTDVEMIAANDRTQRTLTTATTATSQESSSSAMKDEYGAMDDSGETYVYQGDFQLESGQILPDAQLRYQTYGVLNAARDNVVVVCHALTGNASLHAWWGDLLGPNRAFDTTKYFVVCCNILGSCYGSTSPISINPDTGQPYGLDFPDVSVKDTVRIQLLLLQQELQIHSIKAVIGGSFGGMQAVEFAVQGGIDGSGDFCDQDGHAYVRSVIPIACGIQHTAWQIAISEVQRQAIYRDPAWVRGEPGQATEGLQVARQLGMVSYRTPVGYCHKFGRAVKNNVPYGSNAQWQVKSYLEYQGIKFLGRFDPVTYVKLTEQMDSYEITRGRPDDILSRVQIPALVLGIDSDVLYPLQEQEELARQLPNAHLKVIHSDDGHDGFLLEQDQVGAQIMDFLDRHE